MVEKKTKNKTDQAIDLVYAQVQKESGITPMDFFMVGISLAGLGLSMVNASWAPRSLQILTGTILTGLVAIVIISRKLLMRHPIFFVLRNNDCHYGLSQDSL